MLNDFLSSGLKFSHHTGGSAVFSTPIEEKDGDKKNQVTKELQYATGEFAPEKDTR